MLQVNVHNDVLPPGGGRPPAEDVVMALLPDDNFEDTPAPLPSFLGVSMARPSLSPMASWRSSQGGARRRHADCGASQRGSRSCGDGTEELLVRDAAAEVACRNSFSSAPAPRPLTTGERGGARGAGMGCCCTPPHCDGTPPHSSSLAATLLSLPIFLLPTRTNDHCAGPPMKELLQSFEYEVLSCMHSNTKESGGHFKMKVVIKDAAVGLFPLSPSCRRRMKEPVRMV
jgi:hypothetical protein